MGAFLPSRLKWLICGANYGSMDAIREASLEQLADTDGVGEVIAESVHEWFSVE